MSDSIHSPFNACSYREKCRSVEAERDRLLLLVKHLHDTQGACVNDPDFCAQVDSAVKEIGHA